MSELKGEAPLAEVEGEDDFGDFKRHSCQDLRPASAGNNLNAAARTKANVALTLTKANPVTTSSQTSLAVQRGPTLNNGMSAENLLQNGGGGGSESTNGPPSLGVIGSSSANNFGDYFTDDDGFSASLEDLVNTFDDKLTKCFGNYRQDVEHLAPVQARSQDETANECQMWWTLTGNFGNVVPVDWSTSSARHHHLPTLNLNQISLDYPYGDSLPSLEYHEDHDNLTLSDGDAMLNRGLNQSNSKQSVSEMDTHSSEKPSLKTADDVIREIDSIMESESSLSSFEQATPDSTDNSYPSLSLEESTPSENNNTRPHDAVFRPCEYTHSEEKLSRLSETVLQQMVVGMEHQVKTLSETLISELALRDELEFEKELKNSFISLILSVQNRRRQLQTEKKSKKTGGAGGSLGGGGDTPPKYLTTVIPYHMEAGVPSNKTIQVLIKILKAIDEDSPTVPTLLTDYILKVLCPN